jgi:hypothetical protein
MERMYHLYAIKLLHKLSLNVPFVMVLLTFPFYGNFSKNSKMSKLFVNLHE